MTHDLTLPHHPPADLLAALPEHYRQGVQDYLTAARSPRTNQAYAKDWKTFTAWCATLGLDPLPASPSTLVLYLYAGAEKGRKVAGLERALTAISIIHKEAGHPSPRLHEEVRRLLQGIRRTKGTAPRKARPLFPHDLRRISEALPNSLLGKRDRAILLVGFAGAFRREELCALQVADVTFVHEGLEILLRHSKTDQEGVGLKKGLAYGQDPLTCPVRALQDYIEAAGIIEGALFRGINRHGQLAKVQLSGFSIARMIKERVVQAGLPAELASGHSLRSGFATAAARAGYSDREIMRQTGHRSAKTLAGYIREGELWRHNPSGGVGL